MTMNLHPPTALRHQRSLPLPLPSFSLRLVESFQGVQEKLASGVKSKPTILLGGSSLTCTLDSLVQFEVKSNHTPEYSSVGVWFLWVLQLSPGNSRCSKRVVDSVTGESSRALRCFHPMTPVPADPP